MATWQIVSCKSEMIALWPPAERQEIQGFRTGRLCERNPILLILGPRVRVEPKNKANLQALGRRRLAVADFGLPIRPRACRVRGARQRRVRQTNPISCFIGLKTRLGRKNKANSVPVWPGGNGLNRDIRNSKLEIRETMTGPRIRIETIGEANLLAPICETKPIFGRFVLKMKVERRNKANFKA